MPSQHAILSASSAQRWLNCTPSVKLCETFEDKPSEYAAEGTSSITADMGAEPAH